MEDVCSVMVETNRVTKEMFVGEHRARPDSSIFSDLKEVLVNVEFLEYENYEKVWRRERIQVIQVSTGREIGDEYYMLW
jgi:hypothetical protein